MNKIEEIMSNTYWTPSSKQMLTNNRNIINSTYKQRYFKLCCAVPNKKIYKSSLFTKNCKNREAKNPKPSTKNRKR